MVCFRTRFSVGLGVLALLAVAAAAQNPGVPATGSSPAPSPGGVSALLPQLQQTAQGINLDVARLRIDRWKTEGNVKQQAQQNADSISRNVTAALPGMIGQVQANPQSLASAVKLYRNVNALYDVFAGLTESAGAFGSRQEYETLSGDAARLDNIRRSMGEQLEAMAANSDSELLRLRTQAARAAAPPPQPKKVIVDDEKPAKTTRKPAKKKPAASTATPPAAQPQNPPPQH